jgi:chaperonin GroES
MKMKIRPLGDRVLVSRVSPEAMSAGGIVIPETAKQAPTEAIVMAIGEGRLLDDGSIRPLAVKPGDRILFGKYIGTEIELDGEKLLMMGETDILGIIET